MCPPETDISVIVPVHERTAFLEDALESIRTQTIGRKRVETILVSWEGHPLPARFCSHPVVDKLLSGPSSLGGKIALGVESASSEIVAILEDDDLFAPTKLERLHTAFSDHAIGFVANGIRTVGEDLDRTTVPLYIEPKISLVARDDMEKVQSYGKLIRMGANMRLSSMAFRSSILRDSLGRLRAVRGSTDHFIFVSALTSQLGILTLTSPLTVYRVHASDSQARGSPSVILAELGRKSNQHLEDYRIIFEIAMGTPFQRAVEADTLELQAGSFLLGGSGSPITLRNLMSIIESRRVAGLGAPPCGWRMSLISLLVGIPLKRALPGLARAVSLVWLSRAGLE